MPSAVNDRPADVEKWIDELVGVFCDPVVLMPSGVPDGVPEHIRAQITMERLIMNLRAAKGEVPMTATDAEACMYLSTASLEAPLGGEWTRIYLYCFNQMQKNMKRPVPDDLKQETLSNYEMGMLRDLKNWIYKSRSEKRHEDTRLQHRYEREQKRQERREAQPKLEFKPQPKPQISEF